MSCGVIRASTVAIVRDKEFDAAKHFRRYREHWARFGTDPLTAGGYGVTVAKLRTATGRDQVIEKPLSRLRIAA